MSRIHMSNEPYVGPLDPSRHDALCGNRRCDETTSNEDEVTCDMCMCAMAGLARRREEAAKKGKR